MNEIMNYLNPLLVCVVGYFLDKMVTSIKDSTKVQGELAKKLEVLSTNMTHLESEMRRIFEYQNREIKNLVHDVADLAERYHMMMNKLIELKTQAEGAGWKVSDGWIIEDYKNRSRIPRE